MTDNIRTLLEQAHNALTSFEQNYGSLWYSSYEPDKIDATCSSLRAELAKPDRHALQAEGTHPAPCALHCEAPAFQNEIRALKAERDAAMKDAERYRFIRDADRSDCITCELSLYALESLDEYVDAAMEDEARSAIAKAEGDAIKKGG